MTRHHKDQQHRLAIWGGLPQRNDADVDTGKMNGGYMEELAWEMIPGEPVYTKALDWR